MNNHTWKIVDPTDAGIIEALLRKDTRDGEQALMLAVLEDAIECFQKYVNAKDGSGRKLFEEAEQWILDKDSHWLYSFQNICETLGFHPDFVRQGLLCWKEANLRPHSKPFNVRRKIA
jgi:hypothetical protein